MTVSGVKIPGWFIWMVPMLIGAISGAVTASYAYGAREATDRAFEETVNIRLCRIEVALDALVRSRNPIVFAKWETCK